MSIRFVFIALFLILGGHILKAQSQQNHGASTSATSADVKIHKGRTKGVRGDSRITERQGQSMRKKSSKKRLANEARVFQRHNGSGKKEKSSKAKPRGRKT